MQTKFHAVALGTLAAALAGCGGGNAVDHAGYIPTPSPTATSTPPGSAVTNASGIVVDDGSGTPLAGAAVKVMPWGPCGATPSPATSITPESDGCPTPLPSPQATTNAEGQFTLNGVPNGHYLLIIGADAVATVPPGYTNPPSNCGGPCPSPSPVPGSPMQATVHDNVTLTGGNQTLVAPTLPSVPAGYTPPSWETNGSYRLATLDATTEMPCLIAWQYERAQIGLAGSSVDEWLLENVRANNAYAAVAPPLSVLHFISSAVDVDTGGTSCAASEITPWLFTQLAAAADRRALWFGAQYVPYNSGTVSAMGAAEFPADPRSFIDTSYPNWP